MSQYSHKSKQRCVAALATVLILTAATSRLATAADGVWSNTGGGDYNVAGNWVGGTIATGAGFTADFSQVDTINDTNLVQMDSDLTIGSLDFGDTNNAGSPGTWALFYNTALQTITLDNNGASPVINVDTLGTDVNGRDAAFIFHDLAGANGFTKTGAGTLALTPSTGLGGIDGLTGDIFLNEGTLRLDASNNRDNSTIQMADGTTVEMRGEQFTEARNLVVAPNATVTVLDSDYDDDGSTGIFENNYLDSVTSDGTGVMNFVMQGGTPPSGVATAVYTLQGDWTQGSGLAGFNADGSGLGYTPQLRMRTNGSSRNMTPAAFANTAVNLSNTQLFGVTYSYGTSFEFGELSGDASSSLLGGANGGGSVSRFYVGALNTDSTYSGDVIGVGNNGNQGGTSFIKQGSGTLTFEGQFVGTLIDANTESGRQGGVVQVLDDGTLKLTNATSIPGGFGIYKSTIEVTANATLDVSTSGFSSSPMQQTLGAGTIVGNFTHVAGAELGAGDTTLAYTDGSGRPQPTSNDRVPTAGSILFDGDLTFTGGSIVYDMDEFGVGGTNDLVNVSGLTSVTGGGVVDPNFLGNAPATGEVYTLLTSAGGFNVANGTNLSQAHGWNVLWAGRGAAPEVVVNGNDLQFTTTALGAGGAAVIWTGATNNVWDVQGTQNWDDSVVSNPEMLFYNGDSVTFNDAGANKAITLATNVEPGDMTVNNSAGNDYSFTGGSIAATGALLKQGAGGLSFAATNSFSSATIEGGTVDANNAGGVLGSGALTLSGASLVNLGGGSIANSSLEITAATSNTMQFTGSGGSGSRPGLPTLSGSGDLDIVVSTDNSWIDVNNTAGFTGNFTLGPDGVNALTLGTMRIRGFQTDFSGAAVTLNQVQVANQSGSSADSVVFAFGELNTDSGTELNPFVGGSSSKPDSIWQIGGLNTDSLLEGTVVDVPGEALSHIVKVGTGTLTMTNPGNTYTGDTTVEDGTLSVTQAFFADTADVYVGSTATLDLDHALTDVINSLYFGNAPQAVGTYSATGSGLGTDFFVDWITGGGILDVTTLGVGLANPGDYNGDNVVDALDYAVWRENVGGTLPFNETDNVGTVDQGDFNVWLANFGASYAPAPGPANAPEPTALCGLLLAGLAGVARRRSR